MTAQLGFSNPLKEEGHEFKILDPCVLVIFGATGDLTARKLLPALYNLAREGQLPVHFACVAFARRDKDHAIFRREMREAVSQYSRQQPLDETLWKRFEEQIFYHRSTFDDEDGYRRLHEFLEDLDVELGTQGNRVFYLSTQPSFFPVIVERLARSGLTYDKSVPSKKWSRVIIEKPFGHDSESALSLQKHISQHLSESQIYRIDHWLGKETVQNLLTFRFANSIFESLWNNKHVDHVQLTVGEDIGIGTRGRFWEEAGLLRDIVQNHVMQLLTLVAMEPPVNLNASSIRDEKVKVLEAIRPIPLDEVDRYCVRGQYGPGYIGGEPVKAYRDEDNVAETSHVETYAALELHIDNWRWAGVPFYIRGGKRMPKRATEIAIVFKEVPRVLFGHGVAQGSNVLVIRIQPDEGISLRINCKVPGLGDTIQPVKMDFRYGSYFGAKPPEAYERLICDCMSGDSTLFARDDEVIASWKLLTPVLERWAEEPKESFPNYQAGSWGPRAADELLARNGHQWRLV